jgi:hypothetical protein
MSLLIIIIFIIVGILSVFVFPKILIYFLLIAIGYLVIFVNLLWAIAFIPILLIMLYFKMKRRRNG